MIWDWLIDWLGIDNLESQQSSHWRRVIWETDIEINCNNIPKNRPMTDKEILLKQRKESERALKEFKRQIKIWILKEIPQD